MPLPPKLRIARGVGAQNAPCRRGYRWALQPRSPFFVITIEPAGLSKTTNSKTTSSISFSLAGKSRWVTGELVRNARLWRSCFTRGRTALLAERERRTGPEEEPEDALCPCILTYAPAPWLRLFYGVLRINPPLPSLSLSSLSDSSYRAETGALHI